MSIDTSTEAVARHIYARRAHTEFETADLLHALAAERDEWKKRAEKAETKLYQVLDRTRD